MWQLQETIFPQLQRDKNLTPLCHAAFFATYKPYGHEENMLEKKTLNLT